jgi:hypothetical protein
MMLIVSYDLKGPATAYSELFGVLKAQTKWWHYLSSAWLIITQRTPDQLVTDLRPHIHSGDRILIAKIDTTQRPNGWLPKDAWEWIDNNFQS